MVARRRLRYHRRRAFSRRTGDQPGRASTEAFLVDLSPNLPGDFNADGQLDALDIDELSAVVREGSHTKRFDFTDDELVNDDDRAMWVHELKRTYFGDANLDGEFNSSDFTRSLRQASTKRAKKLAGTRAIGTVTVTSAQATWSQPSSMVDTSRGRWRMSRQCRSRRPSCCS